MNIKRLWKASCPKVCLLCGLIVPLSVPAQAPAGGQSPTGAQQHQHPRYPAPSRSTQNETPQPSSEPPAQAVEQRHRLEDLEQMALQGNPTLAQAAANVRAATGRTTQAGLYPNPVIGVTGDEISPGPIIRGGEIGFVVEQRILTAGKRGLSRRVAEQEQSQAEALATAQKYRVLSTVRTLFYEALGAERLVQVRTELAATTRQAVGTSKELLNVGAADQPDFLEAEIEAQRAEVALFRAKTAQQQVWRELAAVVGNASLQPAPLEGNLEEVPKLELESALAKIFSESPEIRTSQVTVAREELALRRARAEPVPDIVARGGLRYNRELLELGAKPVGWEGFFDVTIAIPLFNRNQGNVAVARAELERAQLDTERVKLALRARLARVYKRYVDALDHCESYRNDMLPRARRAYELYLGSFRQMAAAYPQVLIAQRNLAQVQEDYTAALVDVWRGAVEIQGLLLTEGLEAPATAGTELARSGVFGGRRTGMLNMREGNAP